MKKLSIAIIVLIGVALLLWKAATTSNVSNVSDKSNSQEMSTSVALDRKDEGIVKENNSDSVTEFSDYQNKLERDFKSLATVDDLKSLTANEVHHTPEVLKNGGDLIGKIHDEAESDPVKRVDALNFFKRCAEDGQIATAIRAVCLSKVYKLIPEWKLPVPLSEERISREVSELAMKLP
ncbi:hypothetical protein SHI21_13420 [Bacteriovorax sp. PP10]|uniref:Uncharacterized protein n=1 Tax=Bacteriovorax antarcticus TaxID=3088717 RepID=A0ABU5VXY3_9BACT|nr:hypothetical protein [Bacteriovorax sp. PP10]MEA9357218.1 hypothetical protein [Bacteriovorax sp. PP10]